MHETREPAAELTCWLRRGDVLVLTGAGISTDSGIPDYRGPSGRRRHSAPMTYDRFVGSELERQRYWARSHLGWRHVASARPNVSHRALADAAGAGLLRGLVTQNVDGLHSQAGSPDVVDLHGRLDTVICLQCGLRRPRLELAWRLEAVNPGFADDVPDGVERPDGDVVLDDEHVARFKVVACRRCGGILKPDVVFFGEAVPRQRFSRALDLLETSAALVVLGSSLTVGSGYRFVTAAARADLPIAIVNRGATRGDAQATIRIDAPLADVLPAVVRAARWNQSEPDTSTRTMSADLA